MVAKLASFRDFVIRGQFSHEMFNELPRYFAQLLVCGKSTWGNENYIKTLLLRNQLLSNRGQFSYEIFKELAIYFAQLLVRGQSTLGNKNYIGT